MEAYNGSMLFKSTVVSTFIMEKSELYTTRVIFNQFNASNVSYDDSHNVTKNPFLKSNMKTSCLMFGSGVMGNILALIVLGVSPKQQRRTIFYRLVAGLTATDLVGTTMLSPMIITMYARQEWIGGEYMCNYLAYCMIFFGYATMFIVCTMSIERVLCIKHPYVYYTRLSVKHATIFLITCWGLATIVSVMPVLGFGNIVHKWPGTWCFINYHPTEALHLAYNYLYGTLALTVISITMCCNCTVIYTIIRGRKTQNLLKAKNGNTRKYSGKNKQYAECQMLIVLIGVTVVFSSCYTPLMIWIIMNQAGFVDKNPRLDLIFIYVASWNQIIDPWVYILLRREVVWKLISGFKSLVLRTPLQEETINKLPQIQSSETDDENCCVFCLGCLCDPPVQRNRSASIFSESVYDRRTVLVVSTPGSSRKITRSDINNMSPKDRNTSYSSPLLGKDKKQSPLLASNTELYNLIHKSNGTNVTSSL